MTLHLISSRWWPIVCTTSGQFCHYQKGCISIAVCSLLLDLRYPQWYTRLPLAPLNQVRGFTWYCHQSWCINLVSICYSECVTPPIIGGTCLCLSVIWLVIKFHYRLSGKKNLRFKTFIYCTREMTLSWKILFCVLKRNDLITKIYLDLYLASIYVEYMYMCVHTCTMNLHVHGYW